MAAKVSHRRPHRHQTAKIYALPGEEEVEREVQDRTQRGEKKREIIVFSQAFPLYLPAVDEVQAQEAVAAGLLFANAPRK